MFLSGAIPIGGIAGRMRFFPFLIFIALWSIVVLTPVMHWVWGGGGFLLDAGLLDSAGGAVIHLNAGVAAWIGSLVLGRSEVNQLTPT